MKWKECKKLILQDYNRKKKVKLQNGNIARYLLELVLNESFMISFWFRILSFIRTKNNLFKFAYYPIMLYYIHIERLTGIQLPVGTKVGGGICFCQFGSIVIANSACIGKNVSIHPNVTIGRVFGGERKGVPTI